MILVWQVIVDGPPQTLYESDYFEAALTFQQWFPAKPPEMTLKPEMTAGHDHDMENSTIL